MFDKLKNWFGGATVNPPPTQPRPEPPPPPPPKKPRQPRQKKIVEEIKPNLTAKERATAAGEPYIAILKVDIDPKNIDNGAFELDWNVPFLKKLIRAGYHQKDSDTDEIVVDRWFQTVCRNIALEVSEQELADPLNRGTDDVRPPAEVRDLGGGRKEIS
jgi:hypothetical protein